MLRKPLAVLALALAIPVFASGYANYCNSRYGFCVDYPANFGMEPAPVNNDGRVFYDGEGFRMTASGINNVLDGTVKSEMKSREDDFDSVTYRKQQDNWYALSGYKDDNILYVKSWVGSGAINSLYLQYPTAMKDEYDETVNHLVKSFIPGDLEESH